MTQHAGRLLAAAFDASEEDDQVVLQAAVAAMYAETRHAFNWDVLVMDCHVSNGLHAVIACHSSNLVRLNATALLCSTICREASALEHPEVGERLKRQRMSLLDSAQRDGKLDAMFHSLHSILQVSLDGTNTLNTLKCV